MFTCEPFSRFENANESPVEIDRLFSGEGEGLAGVVDHLAHLADAAGALGPALVAVEHILRTRRARLDGEGHVTLAKAVAVADVQGSEPRERLRMVRS